MKNNDTSPSSSIEVRGARVNNLKNINISIPRDRLVVISGLSGSGKSSLAFDTLYAEGQRRYVESLSVYARQFVEKMAKPECDYITGIPPAIAIQQRVVSRTPRSTVGTSTEIYDYLRMLFARIGKTYSPISGVEVKRDTVADVIAFVESLHPGTRFLVTAPAVVPPGRTLEEHLQILSQLGYSRVAIAEKVFRIEELSSQAGLAEGTDALSLVIDRMAVPPDVESISSRLGDSLETAFFEGQGRARIVSLGDGDEWHTREFSDRFEADGILFEEPTDNLFSFNSPVGACPTCEGFSKVMGIDEDLVIQNKRLSVYDDAVMCWRGEKMSKWKNAFLEASQVYDFPVHRPYNELTPRQKKLLWDGQGKVKGIHDFFHYLESKPHKMHYRIMLARYRGRTTCPTCHGKRLKKEALYVRVNGKTIADLVEMPIKELREWFDKLVLSEKDLKIGERLVKELQNRIRLVDDIGLGYLTCERVAGTLSGGESQRINLATSLGSGLIGSLYILDEPSIGLHSRDTHLLIAILRRLADLGNTVVVVEHDEEIIRAADEVIDIGPEAGRKGGEVVFRGSPEHLPKRSRSHTVDYLMGRASIPWSQVHRKTDRFVQIKGAYKHNLKGIDVTIPLRVMSVVTGVSGSGKSTLVNDTIYEGIKRVLDQAPIEPVPCEAITGNLSDIKSIEYIDQNSIGKNSRSNPVTYIGAYDEIRKLMAEQPLSKQMGFTPMYFSFNKEGGRCEYCKGDGVITVEMQFMADIEIECEECHGKRFSEDILEVRFMGMNVYDILEMTVNQAIEFFTLHQESSVHCSKIVQSLRSLQEVGVGYVKLGQSSSTLSGGECQRIKLASYLAKKKVDHTLFIFDEPTTGLHLHDIEVLLRAFDALIEKGHTVLIVEHNLEVVKRADWVIDLGPEGGERGGHLVYQGLPLPLMEIPESYTGKYLKLLFDRQCGHSSVSR